jgi:hypothetical protein
MFDTLVVRSFMTPSIAALLGRWFWWPIKVRPRPASTMHRPIGPRLLVRSLLLGEGEDVKTVLDDGEDVKTVLGDAEAKTMLGDGEAKTAPLPKSPSG